MPGLRVRIEDLSSVPGDVRMLRPAERRQLRTMRFSELRREEWIRGRLAMRRTLVAALGPRARTASVLAWPDGAPHVVGIDCAVALSHDGPWFAVALAPGRNARIGIDLCRRAHRDRLPGLLARLHRTEVALDPVVHWAALECVIKLRGRGIASLLGTTVEVRPHGRRVRVEGIGSSASVRVIERPDFVVAWGVEDGQ